MSMKTSFLHLFLLEAALLAIAQQTALAQDSSATDQTDLSGGSTNSGATGTAGTGQGQRIERFKAAMAQLDLTEAQKEQIKQLRASVTDRKARRQQILAILTPEQKAKLRELIQAHRSQSQGGAGATSSGAEEP